jgi:competence protein ComEC
MHAGTRAFTPGLRFLAIAFTAGVLLAHALPRLPPLEWLGLALLPALAPWPGRRLWLAMVFGMLLTVWRAQALLEDRWPADRHGSDHWVQGQIASLPEQEGRNWRFLFEPEPAAGGTPAVQSRFPQRIRVAWYRADLAALTPPPAPQAVPPSPVGGRGTVASRRDVQLKGGECWRFQLRLRTPHGSLNPGGFDYEGWLFRQGVTATATVRDAERCQSSRRRTLLEYRQHLADEVRNALPEHPAAGLLIALTVGDQSGLNSADWDVFRATGTSHLVAISGFNIAIIAGVAFFLCRWIWSLWPRLCLWLPAQRAGLLGSAVLAGFYALLAGFEPPVQRALLMLWIVLAALWAHRLTEPSRVLALAWLAVLLLDPFAVTSPGLWLSFGAVAAIFYVSLGRLKAPGLWHGLVLLQLLLAVALAPLTLYFFQGASWAAPFVNLLAVPFIAVLTPWVLAALLMHLAWPAAGLPLLQSAAAVLEWFRGALYWAAELPDLWLPASPPIPALLLSVLGVVLLFAPRGLPLRPLGLLCLLPLVAAPVSPPRQGFELTALDVGQGLAVVIRTANHTLLYDAGPAFEDGFDAGESVVAPFLLGQGVRRLDLLFISHGDNDHDGGVTSVRRLLNVERELGSDGREPCGQGQSWEWDGVRFEVLHPDAAAWSNNNGSCVLRVQGPYTVLLAGDIEARAERRLLKDRAADLRADVLIAPHHGSKTSSTAEFVQAVNPKVVIYGAGWRNHFRHPRPEVSARYAALGARQYVTGNSGALAVWRENGELRVEEWRREAAKFWNAPATGIENRE